MGDIIPFPIQNAQLLKQEALAVQDPAILRMRRIQQSLREINEFLERIKRDDRRNEQSLYQRGPSDNWD
jgi:hypothetical protein